MEHNFKPELLAPAGSYDALVAAIRCGADAVYLGGKQFSARKNAKNFDREELQSAVAYARRCGVKIYVTVNTMLFDDEVTEAARFVYDAARLGVHAFIVTDPGLISLLRAHAPDIVLHGSTQMTLHNPQGVEFAKELGLSRAVLAREMTLQQVAEASRCGIETEVFVHGALCVSMSGQCYLSGQLGGRSGNRGLCAQPCRLPFKLGANPQGISLRDLSAVQMLPELIRAGVSSLKIEGRMKRPEYVAAVVTGCRSMLDTGHLPEEQLEIMRDVFSRSGFTNSYLENTPGRELYGFRRYEDVISAQPRLNALHALYKNERTSVPVDMVLTLDEQSSRLTVTDGRCTAGACGDAPFTAQNPDYAARFDETARAALLRTGGTPFLPHEIRVSRPPELVMAPAAVNALRRDVLEQLSAQREQFDQPTLLKPFEQSVPKTNVRKGRLPLWARLERIEQVDALNIERLAALIVPLEALEQDAAHLKALAQHITLYLEPPRIAFGKNAERAQTLMQKAVESGLGRFYCENPWSIHVARKLKADFVCGHFCNIANDRSAQTYRELGASAVVASVETDLQGASSLNGTVGCVVYGKLPLMTYASCPVRNQLGCAKCGGKTSLTDRTGAQFDIICRQKQYSYLINNRPVWLGHRQRELSGLDFGVLYFTDQTADQCAAVQTAFERGSAPDGEFTYGCAFKRVQ
ncbi:MAG: U32 family peptidase [Clostridia bacterium]|nr:U32 family peptidase [Clostridia bacterium]